MPKQSWSPEDTARLTTTDGERPSVPPQRPDTTAVADEQPTADLPVTGAPPAPEPDTADLPTAEIPAAGPPTPAPPGTETPTPAPPGTETPTPRPWWRSKALLIPAAATLVLAAGYGVDLLLAGDGLPRHTVVAGIAVGGLSPAAAAAALESDLAPRVVADHVVLADGVEGTLSPATAGIMLDVAATVDRADDQPLNPWTRLVTLFADRAVAPVITGEETALAAQIEGIAGTVDRAPVDATVLIEGSTPSVVEPVDGRTLNRDGAAAAITRALASGGDPATPIQLPVDVEPVRVDAAEAQRVLTETVTPALSAPVEVVGADGATSAEVPVTAIAASLTFTPQDDGELAVSLDPIRLQDAVGDELAVFGTPGEDARFQISGEAIAIVPAVEGTGVDPVGLAGQLLSALTQPAPRQVTAELGAAPATFTTEAAQALGITEPVSSFTTNFSSAASGTNIRVVAADVNGALIRPGETFSLNGFTGPRTEAQGYVSAGVINNGEFTQAVGGGISQFATTMFNAVFFAGLEDVFHKPHSYYISRYPAGREATVYYDSIDLSWRNDSETGIYVQTEWTPGSITVTFWGTRHVEIESISSDRFNFREPVQQDKPDDGACSPQGGSTGFNITVTRVFRDLASGAELRREEFDTRYAAQPVIRCVPVQLVPPPDGTAPPAQPGPAGRRPGRRPGRRAGPAFAR